MSKKSKDKFYFSHDSNARRDPKLIALRSKRGWAGYGRFFAFVEMLREEENYQIEIDKGYVLASVASELSFDSPEDCKEFIKDCLDFDLLETDGIFVWSNSLNARMEIFEKKRQRYRDMADKRWNPEKYKNKEKNDGKKSEETKSKGETKKPTYKSIESLRDINIFRKIVLPEIDKKPEFKELSHTEIDRERRKCVDWLESKGKRQANYRSFFFNWLRSYIDNSGYKGKNSKAKGMVY